MKKASFKRKTAELSPLVSRAESVINLIKQHEQMDDSQEIKAALESALVNLGDTIKFSDAMSYYKKLV